MEKKKSMYEVTIYVSEDDVPPQQVNFFWSYLAITIASVVLVNTCILMPFLNGIKSFTLWNLVLCILMTALIVHQLYAIHILKKKHIKDVQWYAMSKAMLAFSDQFNEQHKNIEHLRDMYKKLSDEAEGKGENHERQDNPN